MLNICLKCINAFRVIEHPERIDILGSQNTESVKLCIRTDYDKCYFSKQYIVLDI